MLSRFNLRFLTLFLLFFICSFSFAQHYDFSEVWINNDKHYTGTIDTDTGIKVVFKVVKQSRENKNLYYVSGYSTVRNNTSSYKGIFSVTNQTLKNSVLTVTGDYLFTEEGSGKHTGKFSGKFKSIISSACENLLTDSHQTEFTGNWKNSDGTLDFKTNWKNIIP